MVMAIFPPMIWHDTYMCFWLDPCNIGSGEPSLRCSDVGRAYSYAHHMRSPLLSSCPLMPPSTKFYMVWIWKGESLRRYLKKESLSCETWNWSPLADTCKGGSFMWYLKMRVTQVRFGRRVPQASPSCETWKEDSVKRDFKRQV